MKQNFGGHSNIFTIYPICLYREKQAEAAEAAEAGKTEKRKRSVLEVSDSEDNEVNWDNFHADQDLKIQDRKTESNRKLSIDPEMKSKLNELKPNFFSCVKSCLVQKSGLIINTCMLFPHIIKYDS